MGGPIRVAEETKRPPTLLRRSAAKDPRAGVLPMRASRNSRGFRRPQFRLPRREPGPTAVVLTSRPCADRVTRKHHHGLLAHLSDGRTVHAPSSWRAVRGPSRARPGPPPTNGRSSPSERLSRPSPHRGLRRGPQGKTLCQKKTASAYSAVSARPGRPSAWPAIRSPQSRSGILTTGRFEPVGRGRSIRKLLDDLQSNAAGLRYGHPVNRRPNYVFGEWDPHHIDNRGAIVRYVARQDHARRVSGSRRTASPHRGTNG